MDIYKTLSSLEHNPHHLKRYFKFVKSRIFDNSKYSERHHICPKSLFPQYAHFGKNKWNWIRVSAREHYIMHKMLCRVFPWSNKLLFALFGMCNQQSEHQERNYVITSTEYENIKTRSAESMSKIMTGRKLSQSHRLKLIAHASDPYNRIMNSYRQLPRVVIDKFETLDNLVSNVIQEFEPCWGLPNVIATRIGVSVEVVKNILSYKKLEFNMNQSVTKVFLNYNHLFSSYEHYVQSILDCGSRNLSACQTASLLKVNEYGVNKIYQNNGIVVARKKSGPKPKK